MKFRSKKLTATDSPAIESLKKTTEEVVILPNRTEPILAGLRKYKELVYFFTWREFKLRYKEVYLGILWVVLQPLIFMLIVNYIIAQKLGGKFGGHGIPTAFLIYLGFILWTFFEPALAGTVSSFQNNQALYNKLYFPKVLPAVAEIISRLVDFAISFGLLIVLSFFFGRHIPLLMLALLPPALVVMALTAYGAGLFLGTLSIKYKDFKYIVPVLLRLLWFGSPVIWSLIILSPKIQRIFYLNPAGAVIETMRQSWYDPSAIHWKWLILPLFTMIMSLLIGIRYYKRHEREMMDFA